MKMKKQVNYYYASNEVTPRIRFTLERIYIYLLNEIRFHYIKLVIEENKQHVYGVMRLKLNKRLTI